MLSRHLHAVVLLGVLVGLATSGSPAALAQGAPSATATPSSPAPLATSTPTPYLAPGVPPTATGSPTTSGAQTTSGTPTVGGTPTTSGTPSVTSAPPPAATPTPTPAASANQPEHFFGAVQALYNPTMAAQAGVQWERVIFPWSLIQKNGPDTWDKGYFSDDQVRELLD